MQAEGSEIRVASGMLCRASPRSNAILSDLTALLSAGPLSHRDSRKRTINALSFRTYVTERKKDDESGDGSIEFKGRHPELQSTESGL